MNPKDKDKTRQDSILSLGGLELCKQDCSIGRYSTPAGQQENMQTNQDTRSDGRASMLLLGRSQLHHYHERSLFGCI